MPKSNYKKTNRLPRSNASSKLDVGRPKQKDGASHKRSVETIKRLNMYKNSKPIRNKAGKVVAGTFMMKDRAGDRVIDASTGRIQPDRRWFGNTRVVGATELDRFREEMTQAQSDPYSVVLKRKKIPMGLLKEAAEYEAGAAGGGNRKAALLEQEPFEHAFGKQSRRKRVKLDQLFVPRSSVDDKDADGDGGGEDQSGSAGGKAVSVPRRAVDDSSDDPSGGGGDNDNEGDDRTGDSSGYGALLATAQQSQSAYQEVNTREGIVPWGRDSNIVKTEGEGVDWRASRKDDLFLKGQSKRIWGEFFKVVDCSDVVLHVIDARNVPGTRCTMIERHVRDNASHKHLVFILNKIDLVPNWVAKRWMGELAKDRPTIAFHASMTHAFGKGALISLLRQFGKLHEDKKQISVGVIGYPNVGKSSVINTLISKKSCKVAPIPGETKIWQYITLFRRIALIDCPGVVVDTAGDTETDSVLKGVVRAERLETPEDYVDAILEQVKREHIAAQYKLPKDDSSSWTTSTELMEIIAKKSGRLLKGGDPCLRSAAIMLINDFQRGRLPHYVAPPELKDSEADTIAETGKSVAAVTDSSSVEVKIGVVEQDLDAIGEENMRDAEDNDKDGDGSENEEDSKPSPASPNSIEDKGADEGISSTNTEKEDSTAAPLSSEQLIAAGDWDD